MGLTQGEQLALVRKARQDLQQYQRIVRDTVASGMRQLERQERELLSNSNASANNHAQARHE